MSRVLRTLTTDDGETIDVHFSGVAQCLHCWTKFAYWEDDDELTTHVCETER